MRIVLGFLCFFIAVGVKEELPAWDYWWWTVGWTLSGLGLILTDERR